MSESKNNNMTQVIRIVVVAALLVGLSFLVEGSEVINYIGLLIATVATCEILFGALQNKGTIYYAKWGMALLAGLSVYQLTWAVALAVGAVTIACVINQHLTTEKESS